MHHTIWLETNQIIIWLESPYIITWGSFKRRANFLWENYTPASPYYSFCSCRKGVRNIPIFSWNSMLVKCSDQFWNEIKHQFSYFDSFLEIKFSLSFLKFKFDLQWPKDYHWKFWDVAFLNEGCFVTTYTCCINLVERHVIDSFPKYFHVQWLH